ncbi:hypothetical protein [Idiomarina sp.]|uniref:hypothetical protein n=1 Tax=Idiomarina sp. TaxID=1874361 RepID=UPI003A93F3BD
MMKASDLIWPDKWIPFRVRVSVVIVAWILWFIVSYLKYFVFRVDGVLQLISIYPIIIIWTYLFDKTIPMAPGSAYFEADDPGVQAVRCLAFGTAVVAFFGMLFIGDW